MRSETAPAPRGRPWPSFAPAFVVFARNGAIQIGEQLIIIALGLVTTVLIARAFGPADFGVWTLALYVVRIAMGLSGYGLDILSLKECETQDEGARRFLSAAITLRLINMVLILLIGVVVMIVVRPAGILPSLLLVMAPALLVTAFESLEYWFRAARNAVAPAIARLTAAIVGSAAKVALIATGAGMVALGIAHAVQLALIGAVLLVIYLTSAHGSRIGMARSDDLAALYTRALPLFGSQVALLSAMRLDIVILSMVSDAYQVGLYSASLRICEAIFILPVVLMTAASPFLFKLYRTSTRRFIDVFHSLLTAFTIGSLLIAVVIALLSPMLMPMLFGTAYRGASEVLAIQVFALVGVTQAIATEHWWIARKRMTISLKRTFAGALATGLLTLLLAPPFGAVGAAIAMVVSSLVSGIGIHFAIGSNGRHLVRMQLTPGLPALKSAATLLPEKT